MKQYFSIGEVAKLKNITIQTLRYYDKIDLFKPSYIHEENNYRYYDFNQLCHLDILKYLKDKGIPLEEMKEIKKKIGNTLENMYFFLDDQEMGIEEEINQLKEAKLLLNTRKEQLKEQLQVKEKQLGVVYSRVIEERKILKVKCHKVNPYNNPDLYLRNLAHIIESNSSVVDNQYGCIYELKQYSNPDEIFYKNIYTSIIVKDKDVDVSDGNGIELTTIPKGEYICITFNGAPEQYYEHYETLYNYIISNSIKTDGKVYEVLLPNHYSSIKEDDFFTELQVLKK